jgi:hypothetical protein
MSNLYTKKPDDTDRDSTNAGNTLTTINADPSTKDRRSYIPARPTALAEAKGDWPKIPLLRAIGNYPTQTAQLFSLPILVGCIALSGGISLFQKVIASVAVGDALGVITLAGVSIYALVASSAISQMREGIRSFDHDRDESAKTAAIQISIDQMENRREQDRKRDKKEVMEGFEDIIDRVDRLAHELAVYRSKEKHIRKNTQDVWANLARGSTYYSVNGQCLFDLKRELGPDGSIKLTPDYERLIPWIDRYGEGGVARANIVLLDKPSGGLPPSVTPQIAHHLTIFRGLKKLAKAYNVKLRLDRIKFYFHSSSNVRHSFFIGEYGFGENKNVEFVINYTDFSAMFHLPRTLLDDVVEISYSPNTVTKYRHLVEVLIADSPSLSLDDLEQRYGHLVPDPEFDPTFVARNPDVACVTEPDDMIDEIVAFGDHLAIRRRPKY